MSTKRLLATLALTALLAAGCGDDPTTTPDGQPLIFSGLLEDGGFFDAPLVLAEPGTVRIELIDVTAVLVELPESGADPVFSLGIGVGDLTSGECQITFGDSMVEGDVLTVLIEGIEPCLLVFDDGTLPDEAIVSYTVMVDDVKS